MSNQAAVVGKNSPGVYKQAFALGKFLLVIVIEDGDNVDLEFGRNLVAKIEEIVGQTPEMPSQQLLELISHHVSDENFRLRTMVGKIHEQKLTISSLGELTAKLVRKDKVITLIESGNPATIAGPLQQDDLLIMGTVEFFSLATTEFLSEEGKFNPEAIRDRLASSVETAERSETVAGIISQVKTTLSEPELEQTPAETEESELPEKTEEDVLEVSQKPSSPFKSYEITGQSTFSKIAGVFTDLPHFIRRTGMELRREGTDDRRNQSRRRLLFLVLAGFITLVCVVAFQLRSRVTEGQMRIVSQLELQATEAVSSADKLIGLNDQIARENLAAARAEIIAKADEIFGAGWENKNEAAQKKVKEALNLIDARIQQAMKAYRVDGANIFTDFSLLKANPKIISASLLTGKIVVLDQANGALYSVAADTKTAAIIGGSTDLKSGQSVDISTIRAYVLAHDIFSIDTTSNSQPRKVVNFDSDWQRIVAIKSFAGNLYLLDTGANQIWKYQGGETGFATRSAYLQEGLSIDLSKIVDVTIDGSVYVLSKTGNVVKFSGGVTTDFKLTGMTDSFKDPSSIFASEDTKEIYIYDEGNNRVMTFDKTGIYRSQYLLPKLSEKIVKILADESVKKIFLVSATKLYAVDLKQ